MSAVFNRKGVLSTVGLSLMTVVSAVAGLNVALPSLAVELSATQTQLTWIADSYTVVFAGLLLLAGAIGDKYGRKNILAIGLVIFGFASLGGFLATDANFVIWMRAIMGIGAAAIMPSTLSVITTSFPKDEKSKAVGIWVAIVSAGAIVGLFGSALLLEFYAWNSFFALNLILAAISWIGTIKFVPESKDEVLNRLDYFGGILSVIGIGALVFGIIEGPENGWSNPITITSLTFGILGLIFFVLWELRLKNPLLDPRLFKNRGFSAGTISITLQFFGQFGFIFLVVQYLQFVVGFSALESALRILPMALVVGPTSRFAGKLNKTISQKYLGSIGMFMFGLGLFFMRYLTPDFNYAQFLFALFFFAFGLGLAATPATTVIMSSLPQSKQGVASAVNDTAREFGAALGIAILGSALTNSYKNEMATVTANLPAEVSERINSSLAFTQINPPAQLQPVWENLVNSGFEAFSNGMSTSLTIAAISSWVAAALIFVVAPKQNQKAK